jgi:hypothetical protein
MATARAGRLPTHRVCLSLPRVLALVGGLALVGAFFMPWFSAQNLLLSGQFLHEFLRNPGDLRRFVPGSSGTASEAQLLRLLVDLFPASGAVAITATLAGGLLRAGRRAANAILAVSGLVPLVGWAVGITRLPAGASAEIGLWLIALGSIAVLVGVTVELMQPHGMRANPNQ